MLISFDSTSGKITVSGNEGYCIPEDEIPAFPKVEFYHHPSNCEDILSERLSTPENSHTLGVKSKGKSAKDLWKKVAQSITKKRLTLSNPEVDSRKVNNWETVTEKIVQIIKDLREIKAQGYKGVVIKEDFWIQSLYASQEGSAGFPNLTKIWKAQTERLESEHKPTQSFEDWLKGHQEEMNKINPKHKKIIYLSPEEAKEYLAHIEGGLFTFKDIIGTRLLDRQTGTTKNYTSGCWRETCNISGGKGYANFVISKDKEFLFGSHSGGVFHHTSFQKGAVVIGAGAVAIGHMPVSLKRDEIFIELLNKKCLDFPKALKILSGGTSEGISTQPTISGELKVLTSASGHYKPDKENILDTLKVCKEKGIDLSRVILIEESELGESYYSSAQEYLNTQGNCKPYRCNDLYIVNDPDQKACILIPGKDSRDSDQVVRGIELIKQHGIDISEFKTY